MSHIIGAGTNPGDIAVWDGTKWTTAAPIGGAGKIHMWASLQGGADNADGLMQIFNATTGNPGGVIEQTSNAGISNGDVAPLLLPACTLVKATLTYARASVAQGITGGAMLARFDLYESFFASRTLVTSLDFPVDSAGVFSNLGGDNFSKGIVLNTSVDITEGSLMGLQFTTSASDNNKINGMLGMYVYLEFNLP